MSSRGWDKLVAFDRTAYQTLELRKGSRQYPFEVLWREMYEIIKSTGGLVYKDDTKYRKLKIIIDLPYVGSNISTKYRFIKTIDSTITKVVYVEIKETTKLYDFLRQAIKGGNK